MRSSQERLSGNLNTVPDKIYSPLSDADPHLRMRGFFHTLCCFPDVMYTSEFSTAQYSTDINADSYIIINQITKQMIRTLLREMEINTTFKLYFQWIYNFFFCTRSKRGVGIVQSAQRRATGRTAEQSGFDSWIGQKTSSPPQHPDRLWDPPNLLSNGYWGPSSEVERPGRDADHSPLVQRLRMHGGLILECCSVIGRLKAITAYA
jgi:hypothetical protein